MKKISKKKGAEDDTGVASILKSRFRTFSKLAEQAGEGRPLLRGLRVAHDPKADRFVVVHAGSRLEFVLSIPGDCVPLHAVVECRRMDTAGATEGSPIARLQFDEGGVISESTIPELANERLDLAPGAWSVVAAVLWGNMHAQV
jgi:hypothetical protein